jgi:hypothetical protein
MALLPATSAALEAPDARPYFLWWSNVSTQEFREHLRDPEPERRFLSSRFQRCLPR